MTSEKSNLGAFAVKALIAFVVIAGGVFTGMFLSVEMGLTENLGSGAHDQGQPVNKTLIQAGAPLPNLALTNAEGGPAEVIALADDRPIILALVSNGCMPCHQLISSFATSPEMQAAFQLILISRDAAPIREAYPFATFEIDKTVADSLQLYSTPTIVGINGAGKTQFVITGYGPQMDCDFFVGEFARTESREGT